MLIRFVLLSCLLFCLHLITSTPCLAQAPSFVQLTDEDGLPGMTVYNMLQDRNSYIWIGTDNGICRYEGTNFKTFNSPLLKGNEILYIYEHADGKIFFHNLEGQLAYIENEEIHLYRPKGFIDTIGIRGFEFTDEALWIHPAKNKAVIRYTLDKYGQPTQRIPLTSESTYFISYQNEVLGFHKKSEAPVYNEYTRYTFSDSGKFISSSLNLPYRNSSPRFLKKLPDGRSIIAYSDRLFTLKGNVAQLLFKSSAQINYMNFFDQQIYLMTKDGLQILSPDHQHLSRSILPGIPINTALKDLEGNLWLGTADKGLYFIPSLDFQVYHPSNSSIPTNRIYSIYHSEKSDKLLIGQGQGYLSVIKENQLVKNIKTKSEGRIIDIVQDQEGYYYIGNDQHLMVLDPSLRFFKKWFTSTTKHLSITRENHLLISNASYSRLFFSAPPERPLYESENHKLNLIASRSYVTIQDFSDRYWIGTTQGLFIYTDTLSPFIHGEKQPYYSINTIIQASDSTIWVGTQSDGLLQIKDQKLIKSYTLQEGLVSNKVKDLHIDQEGDLWIGTDKGLQVMNPKTGISDLINKLDGLPSNDITAIYTDGQEIWLGTIDGLVHFNKKNIRKNTIAPPIRITAMNIWERDTSLQDHYDLRYDQTNLSFAFEGINFRSRGNTRYRYRMIGVDTQWITTPTQLARYPTLNPGDYQFEVVAVNEDGEHSQTPARIRLSISPPWWKTWWFISLAILGGIGLIAAIFYFRLQTIRRREQEKQAFNEQMNELKMQALQVQMNPHFVFNALNAIQKYLTTNEQEQAMIYLARFARLIRLIFEQSKKKEISLDEEFEFLKLYLALEKLRFNDKVDIQFIIEDEVRQHEETIKIPPLLIQPVIENAFKHGLLHKKGKGLLKIHFSKANSSLLCVVEDNGVGREKALEYNQWKPAEYHSSGLATTKQRLTIFNNKALQETDSSSPTIQIEDLKNEQGEASGTRVQIHLNLESFYQF